MKEERAAFGSFLLSAFRNELLAERYLRSTEQFGADSVVVLILKLSDNYGWRK